MFSKLKEKLKSWFKKSEETAEKAVEKAERREENIETTIKQLEKKSIDISKKGKHAKEEKVKEKLIEEKAEEKEEKGGFFTRIREKFIFKITEEYFEEVFSDLETILLENNIAFSVVEKIKSDLKKELIGLEIKKEEVKEKIMEALKISLESLFVEKIDLIKRIKEKEGIFVILFFGINGSGKCISGNSDIQLSDGNIKKIEELYREAENRKIPIMNGEDCIIENPGIIVPSLNLKTLKIENKEVSAIWKLKPTKFLYKIILKDGKEIITTPEHPFFSIENGIIKKIRADNLKNGIYIAIPKYLPIGNTKIDLIEKLNKGFFININTIEEFYNYLETEYGSLQKAYSELNIKRSFNTFAYFWKNRKIIPIEIYNKFKSKLKINSLQYSGSKPIPLIEFSDELVELAGLIMAEGHLDKKILEITNKNAEIIKRFEYLIKKIFNITPKSFVDGRGLIRSRVFNWSAIYFLSSVFDIPFGKKASIIRVPEIIMKADKEKIISFLRSYLEAEAHISKENRTIEISTASYDMAKGLSYLFAKLGILTTISKRKYKTFSSYRVYINGYLKFEKTSQLGLYTKKSISKLNASKNIKRQFEITELIPNTGSLIKSERIEAEKYQSDFAKVLNSTQPLISHYESSTPIPRKNMMLLSQILKNKYLNLLATSDISWIKIESIEKIKAKDEAVYDLTIDENHNFIANGIIVHNTTSIAKLASLLKKNNISCVLAAADTFRAASIEQLEKHGENLKVEVIKSKYDADPASVAFDAIKHAKSKKIKAVLIDTAGRMHTKENLMKEMEKIERISKPDLKIFVAESITGNDATEQACKFNEAVGIDAIILSKADVDSRGGTIISVSYVTGKPILFLGTGQDYKDLEIFDRKRVIENLGL